MATEKQARLWVLLAGVWLLAGCGLKTAPEPIAASEQQPYVQNPLVLQRGEELSVSWRSQQRPDTLQLQVFLKEPLCLDCQPRLQEELLLQDELRLGQNEVRVPLPPPVAPMVEVQLTVLEDNEALEAPVVVKWTERPFFPSPQPMRTQVIGVEEERTLPQGEVSLILTVAEEAGWPVDRPEEGTLTRRTDLVRLSWDRPLEFQGTVADENGLLWKESTAYRVNVYPVEASGTLAAKPLNPAPLESRYWVYRRPRPAVQVDPSAGTSEVRPGVSPKRGAFYIDIKVIPQDTYNFTHVLVDRFGNESSASPTVSQALPAAYPSWWLQAMNLFPSSL